MDSRILQERGEKLQAQTTSPVGCTGDQNLCDQNLCCEKAVAEPLIWSLRRQAVLAGNDAARKNRAIEILERHPEFEELIELLRIVPIW